MALFHAGPSGGDAKFGGVSGVQSFSDDSLVPDEKVHGVRIAFGAAVDGVQMIYKAANGTVHDLPASGNVPAAATTFLLDDDEYITGVSGRWTGAIDSIKFHTNKQTSISYGGSGGINDFIYECPPSHEICGFFGKHGFFPIAGGNYDILLHLGVLIRPKV